MRSLPRRWALVGGACVAAYQLGFFAGLARTGVSVGTVVAIGSGPILAGALAHTFLNERPTRRWLVATSFAITGVVLISLTADDKSLRSLGIALVVLAGLGYAGFTILTREAVVRGVDGPLLLGALFTIGALFVLPFCIGRPFGWISQARGAAVVLWLGIGPTAVAYTLFANGLRTLTGPVATTFVLAEPVTAVLLGRVVLGEHLGSVQWFGAALVLAALIALASRSPHHAT
jgi:drug/metabolite transporter, DME family